MPLTRTMTTVYQVLQSLDLNRTNNAALSNLVLALRGCLAPSYGIVRGCQIVPAATPMFATVQPGAALVAGGAGDGLVIIETDTQIGPFAPNAGSHSRMDLVSLRYVEGPSTPEPRAFKVNGVVNTATVNTQIIVSPQIVITQGDDSGNTPALPVGDLSLGIVAVRVGATSIVSSDIASAFDARNPLVAAIYRDGAPVLNAAMPWTESSGLAFNRSAGSIAAFYAATELHTGSLAAGVQLSLVGVLGAALSGPVLEFSRVTVGDTPGWVSLSGCDFVPAGFVSSEADNIITPQIILANSTGTPQSTPTDVQLGRLRIIALSLPL